jgi:hypothetical protein
MEESIMLVYVVTSGEYSDYHICGVFSSEEKAKTYMGNAPEKRFSVEEYELDGERPRVFAERWGVALKLDGSVANDCSGSQHEDVTESRCFGDRGSGYTTSWAGRPESRSTYCFVGHSYVSADHDMKLAVEQRQKALREHPKWFTVPAEGSK